MVFLSPIIHLVIASPQAGIDGNDPAILKYCETALTLPLHYTNIFSIM